MKLTKQVALDLMAAMKNQEKVKLDAIRALKTAFILAKAETGAGDLDDATELKIVQKLIKQRRDSAAEYQANNRKDLADKENAEADVLMVYLPQQLSVEELEAGIKEIVTTTGATSMKDMGKVMGVASKKFAGVADGKTISDIVKKLLA
ncbi:MAG: GatB/YqeY domain-containing protein [Bacteroidales bacterium]|nr:GatB/YqeY domain-containing protein [Bacteroidales bacterium]